MKLATCLVMALVLCCSAAFANQPVTTKNAIDLAELEELKTVTGTPDPQPQVGGEDIATAVNIPVLPYSDGGNTCVFADDYDETCPFSGSTAPDVVYSHSPLSDIEVTISLCNSGYDTKVFVYENSAATLVDCNDDACGSDGFRSELACVPMTAGNTYYIVVDGYFGACGTYDMTVSECLPLECPPGAQLEGEPDCFDDYKDAYNGGCNSTPNVFTSINCSFTDGNVSLCGRYGGFFHSPSGFDYRDTDWYSLDPAGTANGITYTVTGDYATLMGYLNANLGCGAPVFVDFLSLGPLTPGTLNIPGGNWWLFCATSGFGSGAGACGGDYVIDLTGYLCPPVSVEAASWGQIKGKYTE